MINKIIIVLLILVFGAAGYMFYTYQNKTVEQEMTNNELKASPKLTDNVLTTISGTVASINGSEITIKTSVLAKDKFGYGTPVTENKTVTLSPNTKYISVNKKLSDIKPGSTINVFYYENPNKPLTKITASSVQLVK